MQHRATFNSPYVFGTKEAKKPRLRDCLLCIAEPGGRDFFAETQKTEFAVLDVLSKSKAWYERPPGADESQIEAMIESHFGTRAFRADTRLWFVCA